MVFLFCVDIFYEITSILFTYFEFIKITKFFKKEFLIEFIVKSGISWCSILNISLLLEPGLFLMNINISSSF